MDEVGLQSPLETLLELLNSDHAENTSKIKSFYLIF